MPPVVKKMRRRIGPVAPAVLAWLGVELLAFLVALVLALVVAVLFY
jgi:hypothetical protein